MAYMVMLQEKCAEQFCNRRPTYEVFNTFNSSLGRFCSTHATKRVKELKADEKKIAEVRRKI